MFKCCGIRKPNTNLRLRLSSSVEIGEPFDTLRHPFDTLRHPSTPFDYAQGTAQGTITNANRYNPLNPLIGGEEIKSLDK